MFKIRTLDADKDEMFLRIEDVRMLHISHASTQRGCWETYEILKSSEILSEIRWENPRNHEILTCLKRMKRGP